MHLRLVLLGALGLCACGPGSNVCPTGWSDNANAPGQCEAPASFVSDTQAAVGNGIYGFVRTNAHGGSLLVVGTLVFAIPSAAGSCSAASVNAVAQTQTDTDGVFVLAVPPGDYLVTSGEVPSCTPVHVDANTLTDVALTSP